MSAHLFWYNLMVLSPWPCAQPMHKGYHCVFRRSRLFCVFACMCVCLVCDPFITYHHDPVSSLCMRKGYHCVFGQSHLFCEYFRACVWCVLSPRLLRSLCAKGISLCLQTVTLVCLHACLVCVRVHVCVCLHDTKNIPLYTYLSIIFTKRMHIYCSLIYFIMLPEMFARCLESYMVLQRTLSPKYFYSRDWFPWVLGAVFQNIAVRKPHLKFRDCRSQSLHARNFGMLCTPISFVHS